MSYSIMPKRQFGKCSYARRGKAETGNCGFPP